MLSNRFEQPVPSVNEMISVSVYIDNATDWMKRQRRSWFLIILASIIALNSGCAVYDPKRGVFVSSSVQDVTLEKSTKEAIQLILLPFGAPKEAIIGRASNENIISGVYVVANFTYVFDDVDQNNLRLSLVESINKSRMARIHDAKSAEEANTVAGRKVHIEFNRSGIVPGALVSKCIIDANVLIERDDEQTLQARINAEGTSAFSIANAKNDAIQTFVREFADLLKRNPGPVRH